MYRTEKDYIDSNPGQGRLSVGDVLLRNLAGI